MSNVQSYIQTSKALREAYDELKYGRITRSKFLTETFEPIVKPLEGIMNGKLIKSENEKPIKSETEKPVKSEELQNFIGDTAMKYLKMYSDKDVKTDRTFGFHTKGKEMLIGSDPVLIVNNDIHFSDGQVYRGTDGLWQLLALQRPKDYSDEDYNNFVEIILKTNSYRRNNDPDGKYLKSSSGYKYNNYIKPILVDNDFLEVKKKGRGLKKIFTDKPVEYVYWNTLDELLEKLYIAYGEIKAGNKNPLLYNEITSILEEIREI